MSPERDDRTPRTGPSRVDSTAGPTARTDAFAAAMAAARLAVREGRVLVTVRPELADALRIGVAPERAALVERGEHELPELVMEPAPVPGLRGWSPVEPERGRRRGGRRSRP